jgi:hypothetical protein
MAKAADANENEIEKVRQIVNVASFSEVEARVRALNDAAWDETVEDIIEWMKIRNKFGGLSGGRFGIVSNKEGFRLEIRNRVRTRLGYPEVDANGQVQAETGILFFGSSSVKKNIVW